MPDRHFGHIEDIPEGAVFGTRQELHAAGVHRPLQAGISGSAAEGADSIVVSGGYEDDQDDSDVIVYTGHGGRDPDTGQQVADQLLTRQNLALAVSCQQGLPIRVVRGANSASLFAPAHGYRYDGLFRVASYWRELGRSRHVIWRFRLEKIDALATSGSAVIREGDAYQPVERRATTILRIVRDTEMAREIKRLYQFQCQVCGIRLEGLAGPYAEAAHIRPLGAPHNGPDELYNLLCLCPNHHVLLDYGAFAIDDDLSLLGIEGTLFVLPQHDIKRVHLHYRRSHYFDTRKPQL